MKWQIVLFKCLCVIRIVAAQLQVLNQENNFDMCTVTNQEYFKLIGWYLGRSMDLTFALIGDDFNDASAYFASIFLRDFMKSELSIL